MLSDALEKELVSGFKDAYPLVSWLRQIKTPIAE
jgi:hypothetical protein